MDRFEELKKKSEELKKKSDDLFKRSDELIRDVNRHLAKCYAIIFDIDRPKMEERDLIGCLLVGQKLPEDE